MKALHLFIIVFLITAAGATEAFSQRGRQNNMGPCNLPGLTEEQQSQIGDLRTAQIASSTTFRARMNELSARKNTLSIAENPDMNQINQVIEEMEKLRTEHLKAQAAHKQAVRKILTSEQRAVFDSRQANRDFRPCMNDRPQRRGNVPNRMGRGRN